MDYKIWQETILTWVNVLGLPCNVSRIEQVKENFEEIIKLVAAGKEKNIVKFINDTFPNYVLNEAAINSLTDLECVCICTLILIYVCFSEKNELEVMRSKMCLKLESSVQEYIADFLSKINEQEDVFSITSKIVTDEIMKFSQRHCLHNSASGDGLGTPIKTCNSSINHDSPLLEFLQTPKRKSEIKPRHLASTCTHSDQLKKIKELTDQLVEEELNNASLQERLKWHEIKCNDYEIKLKSKLKELEKLKSEWQDETSNHEKETKKMSLTIEKNLEERNKLSKDLLFAENYSRSLEKELSNVLSEKKNLEAMLKSALQKVDEYDDQIRSLNKINTELEELVMAKEAELCTVRESFRDTTVIDNLKDMSMNETLNTSVTVPENMGIITEILLRERTLENETLKEAVDALKSDKECLTNEVRILKARLSAKVNEHQNLREFTKQLMSRMDGFVKACKELQTTQRVYVKLMQDVDDMTSEKMKLIRKSDVTNVLEAMNLASSGNVEDVLSADLFNDIDSRELHVIYDSSKELTDSASQFSFDDNETTHLTTIIESLNESEDTMSRSESVEPEKGLFEQFQMEELNQEIITAKKSLIAFLRASMKNFEVLKIKENLINEMSKQHEHLESRITSLTELNTRLTKEVINSKNISQIDSEFREKELDNLRLEVESLKKASNLLKEKLADLEKTNEILVSKKEECLSELALLRERNKSLNNDLQNRVMLQLKQHNSCLGFIRSKQETELELERTLKIKDDVDKRLGELRKMISYNENKLSLEIMLNAAEQKFYVTSQNLLHITYSCLKWSAKSMEYQCFLIGQGDNFLEDDAPGSVLKEEQEANRERLKEIMNNLKDLKDQLDVIEAKCNAPCELSDSLEVVPSSNKTFDIINLDDREINDLTFSIRKEELKQNVRSTDKENVASWVISPPSKISLKKTTNKYVKKEKPSGGESWVVPMTPEEKKAQTIPSAGDLVAKKSSYSSAITQIEYSPNSGPEVKRTSSVASFASATDSVVSWDLLPGSEVAKEKTESTVNRNPQTFNEEPKVSDTESDSSVTLRKCLEKKVLQLQKEVFEARKENEKLRLQLAECEESRRQEKENWDKHEEVLRQNITSKYETQLEHLKSEMKALYNTELAKHKADQSKMNFELREQNKLYKDHVDELRNQLWDLGEKLLHEQKVKRDLERSLAELKSKLNRFSYSAEIESRSSHDSDSTCKKERSQDKHLQSTYLKHFGSTSLATIPVEDEDEVFDNRFLEDMKAGICRVEGPEGRLTELQLRNSQCPPHLKSSYPAETQFHNPKLFRENDLKYGTLTFGQESQSLTDSDHSMTRSLLPEEKVKKKEQTSYKKPGPPTPSKNGGRVSIQSGEFHLTPRKILRDSNEQCETKTTPGRIKSLFTVRSSKRDSLGYKDENAAPIGTRGKKLKIFPTVKPFGSRLNFY